MWTDSISLFSRLTSYHEQFIDNLQNMYSHNSLNKTLTIQSQIFLSSLNCLVYLMKTNIFWALTVCPALYPEFMFSTWLNFPSNLMRQVSFYIWVNSGIERYIAWARSHTSYQMGPATRCSGWHCHPGLSVSKFALLTRTWYILPFNWAFLFLYLKMYF